MLLYEHDAIGGAAEAHVLFDALAVGRAQGARAAERIAAMPEGETVKVARGKGNEGEFGITMYEKGQNEFLQPLIDEGRLEVECEDFTPNWEPVQAQDFAENCLPRTGGDVDMFIGMNDGTTGGAVAALISRGFGKGEVVLTGGQDATIEAPQFIVQGWPDNTIAGLGAWLLVPLRLTTWRRRKAEGLPARFFGSVPMPVLLVGGILILVTLFPQNQRGLPMPVILFLALLEVTAYQAGETRFGLYLYAIGNNAEAARRAGLDVDRIKITAFPVAGAIAGALAAFGGILSASRILGVSVSSGGGVGGGVGGGALLLESIAAAVIGGGSLFGGRGAWRARRSARSSSPPSRTG